MRLQRLRLECYGNFADAVIELDGKPGRINLVVAPNGAGKSVVRQAISELLFGIHTQTPMGFQFGYDRMRLMASAGFGDGEAFGFVRRKGRANTLTDPSGQPAHPVLLARMPREADRKRLERLFVLDSAQLRAGGRALLQTDGDLADALLSGAGELGSARSLAADLVRRRDEAAPTRRSLRTPFYEAGDAWGAANTRLAETLVRPPAVAEQEALRAAAVQDRDEAAQQSRDAAAELARLSRLRSTRRHFDALDAATRWLEQNAGAPKLAPAVGAALAAAKQAAEAARLEQREAAQQAARLAEQFAVTQVDEAALAEAAAIERLLAERAVAENSRTDIPKREREMADAQVAITRLLRELASPADPADAKAELRGAADIAAARVLIGEAADLAAKRTAAQAALARDGERLAEAEDELAALPALAATDALRAAQDEALADGDPARAQQAAAKALADADAHLADALTRLPGTWDAAALAVLPVAAEASWARLDKAVTEARSALSAAEQRRDTVAAELAAGRGRLADLTRARPLPDRQALAAARMHRDRGWALVFARLSGAPQPEAEAAYAGGVALAIAFERAIAAADAVADRREEEVERLASAEQMQGAIDRAETVLAASEAAMATRQAVLTQALAAWANAVAPTGLAPACGLAEIRAFIAARETVVGAAAARRSAAASAALLAERHAGLAARLAAALGSPVDTLAALIASAKRRLAEADQTAANRTALNRTASTARRAVERARPALERAEAELADWSGRWDGVLAKLRRPPGEAPNVTASVLDQLVALPAKVEAAETAQQRLAEMHGQLERFGEGCATVAGRLAEPAGEPGATALRLRDRLTAARAAFTTRKTLAGQADAAAQRQRAAEAAFAEAGRHLQDAVAAAGAAVLEEAERLVSLAAERSAQEAAQDLARLRLREDGEGLDIETLRMESEATPADQVAEAVREAEDRVKLAREAAQDAAARIERADGTLRGLAAGQDAARAAGDRQAAAAKLSHVLEEALVQHLAAAMLEHALAEVEASTATNQRLARIGETFASLTGGAYDRLSPGEEDSESKEHGRLIAHERGGGEKHIGRLSEGTRDQLYLALRLVAIEDHVRAAPGLPFVADDVLQTFDDTRARAAMEALVRLSEHVQVVVLTHHPHLLAVAEGLPVHVQRL